MPLYIGPKNKLSRREGKDLFGNGGEALQRRLEQAPGAPPQGRYGRKESDYARQLRAKQMVKRMYGMRERQFRRFFQMALRTRGLTGLALLRLLERRLDNVIYRLGLARTRPQARQFVNHGHVLVDGRRVNIPSFLIEPGQQVSLVDAAREMPDIKDLMEYRPPVPGWLEAEGAAGRMIREPLREEIDPDIQEQLIIEFYSR